MSLNDIGFLRLPEVLKLIPISRSSLYARIKLGTFPKPKKIGPRAVGWSVADIREYLEKYPDTQHNQ